MTELAAAKGRDTYDVPYLKKRIEEKFKGKIVIANVNGNPNVIHLSNIQNLTGFFQPADVKLKK